MLNGLRMVCPDTSNLSHNRRLLYQLLGTYSELSSPSFLGKSTWKETLQAIRWESIFWNCSQWNGRPAGSERNLCRSYSASDKKGNLCSGEKRMSGPSRIDSIVLSSLPGGLTQDILARRANCATNPRGRMRLICSIDGRRLI